jgi:uncharacterized small protein (DUF1192 family)
MDEKYVEKLITVVSAQRNNAISLNAQLEATIQLLQEEIKSLKEQLQKEEDFK